MDLNKIADFLKSLRKAKGMTQDEVAQKLFVSPKTVSRWESGAGIPDINIITSVAELYDVSVDELLKGERKITKHEELSEQTLKLKDRNATKIVKASILKKHNTIFIISLCIEGGFFLLELLIALLESSLASLVMMPIGLIAAIVVMVLGNKEITRQFDEEDDSTIISGVEKAKKDIRKKNILFSDIMVGFIILSILLMAI